MQQGIALEMWWLLFSCLSSDDETDRSSGLVCGSGLIKVYGMGNFVNATSRGRVVYRFATLHQMVQAVAI